MDLLTGPLPAVDNIEFGKLFCPTFVTAEYRQGRWSELQVGPLRALELHPAAVVFHYGQSIFEGLKAFSRPGGEIGLFRPELNARRFHDSAERLMLPLLPEATFLRAVTEVVANNIGYVPPRPGSLYVRPAMFGSEPSIGVRSSREALFFAIGLPAGAYFKETRGGKSAIKVFVDEDVCRAAPGGTGNVKTSANYAGTLLSIHKAKEKGCAQALYLDALGRGYFEEMGGMNIFVVLNGTLVTPPLTGTILPGITRASVIEAARHLGIPVEERPVSVHEVRDASRSGTFDEAFACGTAVTIAGVREFVFQNQPSLVLPAPTPGPITERLLNYIQGIQYGSEPDVHGWIRTIPKTVDICV